MALAVLAGVVAFAAPAWAAQPPKPPQHPSTAGPPGQVGTPRGQGPLGNLVDGLGDALGALVDQGNGSGNPGNGSGNPGNGSGNPGNGGGSVGGGVSGETPPQPPTPPSTAAPSPGPVAPVPTSVPAPALVPTNVAPTASSAPTSTEFRARAEASAQGVDASAAAQDGVAQALPSEAPTSGGDAASGTGAFGAPLIVGTPRIGWLLLAVAVVAVIVGMGIRHVTMRRQIEAARRFATRDPLTGLANRRLFDESLAREVARQRRHGGFLAVAVIDLDHFKAVNDSRGHAGGDAVLRQVAGAIDARVRASDLPARIGGDEFAVLLPECAPTSAQRVAEALRTAIDDIVGPTVTASVGIAVMPDHADDADALLAAADAALYAAKGDGRNRVACVS